MSVNIENINYNDLKNICRTCMCNCDLKFTLKNVILDVFYKLTDTQFETNDNLPKQTCLKCFEKLHEIHEFSSQCKQTHLNLQKFRNNIKNKQIKYEIMEETNKPIKIKEEMSIEHKIEFVGVNDFNSRNDDVNDKLKIKHELPEYTNNELNDEIIPETRELNTINIEIVEEANTNELNNKYECKQCSKTFSVACNLRRHMRVHSDERPYKCKQCSKSFRHMKNLRDHRRTHSGERPHACDQCEKSFTLAQNLRVHMRTHSGERPYECDQCSKSINEKAKLSVHMSVHSGDRPYKCDQCSKTFTEKAKLKNHMQTHSGERPFKCDQCSKSFARTSSLKRHLVIHSGERPYTCDQCCKSFTQTVHLKVHMRTNSGELLYE